MTTQSEAKKEPTFCYDFARPSLTADAIVWTVRDARWQVLLIERGEEPFAGRFALPGGFVEPNEPLEDAARRELKEETGITVGPLFIVNGFGGPDRDPRGWTATVAYYAFLNPSHANAAAGDDARQVGWKPMQRLPALAFDHRDILAQAKRRLAADLYTSPVAAPMLPDAFSAAELGAVYGALGSLRKLTNRRLARLLLDAGVLKTTSRGGGLRFASKRKN